MIVADPGLGFGAEQNPAYRPSGIFLGLPRFALLEAGFFLRAYRPSAYLRPVGLGVDRLAKRVAESELGLSPHFSVLAAVPRFRGR